MTTENLGQAVLTLESVKDEIERLSESCLGHALTKEEAEAIVSDLEKQIIAAEITIVEISDQLKLEFDEEEPEGMLGTGAVQDSTIQQELSKKLVVSQQELASLRIAVNLYQQIAARRARADVEKDFNEAHQRFDLAKSEKIKDDDKIAVPAGIAKATKTEAEKVAEKQLAAAQEAELAVENKIGAAAKMKQESGSELKLAQEDLAKAEQDLASAEEVKDFSEQNYNEYNSAGGKVLDAQGALSDAKMRVATSETMGRTAAKELIDARTARYFAQDAVAKAKAAATSVGSVSKVPPPASPQTAWGIPIPGVNVADGRPRGGTDACSLEEPELYIIPDIPGAAQTTRDAIIDAINMGLGPTAIGDAAQYPDIIDIWSWGGHKSGHYCNSKYDDRLLYSENMKLDKIILHDSDEATPALTIYTLRKWSCGTHYTIDKSGRIRQHVPPINAADEIVKDGEGNRTIGSLKHASTDEYVAGVKKFSVKNSVANNETSISIDICNFVSLKGNRAESWLPPDTYPRVDVIENATKSERTPAAEFALEDRQKALNNPLFFPRGNLKGLYLEDSQNSGESGNKYGIQGHPVFRRRSPGSGQTGHVTGDSENHRFVQEKIKKTDAKWYKEEKGKDYFLAHLKHQLEACYQLCLFLTNRDEFPDLRLKFPAADDPNGFYWGTDPAMVKQIAIYTGQPKSTMTIKSHEASNIKFSKPGIMSHARMQIGRTDGLLQEHYLLCRKNKYSVAAAFERTIIAARLASDTGNYTKLHLPGFETKGIIASPVSSVKHDPNIGLNHDGVSEAMSRTAG